MKTNKSSGWKNHLDIIVLLLASLVAGCILPYFSEKLTPNWKYFFEIVFFSGGFFFWFFFCSLIWSEIKELFEKLNKKNQIGEGYFERRNN